MAPKQLVIVGGGMVAHRLVEALRDRGALDTWEINVFSEETRPPYDRVALTSFFTLPDPEDLLLGDGSLWRTPGIRLHVAARVQEIDVERRVVRARGREWPYDAVVLATGSSAAVPPVPGADATGCFVYRTVDDVTELRGYVHDRARVLGRRLRGAVVGGGLLGLEAAGAMQEMGVQATVVEFADRLMPMQIDAGGGDGLRRLIEGLGVSVRTGTATSKVRVDGHGRVRRMRFEGGESIDADVVVFATGVRPRDELGRAAGLEIGERGGIVVDEACATSSPDVYAIGEVACLDGRCWGLVAPGYTMAEVVADRLLGGDAVFPGADTSTKLKLLGVDVASFGDAFGQTEGALEIVFADPVAGTYKKLVMSDDAQTLLGGILVGDAGAYAALRPMVGATLPGDPTAWLVPEGLAAPAGGDLPDEATVCSCNNVSAGTIRAAVTEHACTDLATAKTCTRAGTSCGSCLPLVKKLVGAELERNGVEVSQALCEHFDLSRAQLFDVVRVKGLTTFSDILATAGTGRGCDICRPVIASILASLDIGHVMDPDQARLQDTNDHVMANLQRDGSYSVVPRIPGGEITPRGLIVIGEIAEEFGLYTKITGGQRIDMFGARLEQLPSIWQRLVEAGFESGHAYGKSLRTVKSCVGSTWCRFGVQDSVALAIALELRYRGLRAPHKLKLGVSGCARECAEARSKDVGVIATDHGWNLYVGGNGGFTPRHAQLLAEDLSTADLVRVIDRFLMYYVRTGDRLQRTAAWLEERGLDEVRGVVLEDSLGIGAELEAAMARHVDSYEDEWAATLADPAKRARFVSFLNAPEQADDGQRVLTEAHTDGPPVARESVFLSGPTLEVRA